MKHTFWIWANLVVPFLLPVLVVKVIRLLLSEPDHPNFRKKLRLTYLFRDGQYALTTLAVSAATMYELSELGEWSSRSKVCDVPPDLSSA